MIFYYSGLKSGKEYGVVGTSTALIGVGVGLFAYFNGSMPSK